jgi:hypothetical protein
MVIILVKILSSHLFEIGRPGRNTNITSEQKRKLKKTES